MNDRHVFHDEGIVATIFDSFRAENNVYNHLTLPSDILSTRRPLLFQIELWKYIDHRSVWQVLVLMHITKNCKNSESIAHFEETYIKYSTLKLNIQKA